MRGASGLSQRPLERRIGLRVVVVPGHVLEEGQEATERALFQRGAGLRDTVGDPRLELRLTPRTGCHSDHWDGEDTPLDHRVERGKDHLVGEVTRQAEQYQRIGRCRTVAHPASALSTITCASWTMRFNCSLPRKLSA